jgi:hypothetical protein
MRHLALLIAILGLVLVGCGGADDPELRDRDGDGVLDRADNCPININPDQADDDHDGVGNACQTGGPDNDHDGVLDDADDCPNAPNPDQADSDHDGMGDACEPPVDAAIHYSWQVDRGGQASTCAAAGVFSVSMIATRDSDVAAFDDIFACADLAGLTEPVGLNETFVVAPCALDASDNCLSDSSVTFDVDTTQCDSQTGSLCISNAPNVIFDIP